MCLGSLITQQNLKGNDTNDSQTYKTDGCQGKDSWGVWDGYVHTAIFKMDNQQGPTVQHMELYSVLCASLDGREIWGRMDTCICMAESLCCLPETTTLLIS